MNHPLIQMSRSFARKHETYCWFAIELAIICGAAYSIPGLITGASGALAAGPLWLILANYLLVPFYAAALFVLVTGVVAMIMIVPYAVLFGQAKPVRKSKKAKTTKASKSLKETVSKPAFLRRKAA